MYAQSSGSGQVDTGAVGILVDGQRKDAQLHVGIGGHNGIGSPGALNEHGSLAEGKVSSAGFGSLFHGAVGTVGHDQVDDIKDLANFFVGTFVLVHPLQPVVQLAGNDVTQSQTGHQLGHPLLLERQHERSIALCLQGLADGFQIRQSIGCFQTTLGKDGLVIQHAPCLALDGNCQQLAVDGNGFLDVIENNVCQRLTGQIIQVTCVVVGSQIVAVQCVQIGSIVTAQTSLQDALVLIGAGHFQIDGDLNVLFGQHLLFKLLYIRFPLIHILREAHHDVQFCFTGFLIGSAGILDRGLCLAAGRFRIPGLLATTCSHGKNHAQSQYHCQ